jgi:hypothetical protein
MRKLGFQQDFNFRVADESTSDKADSRSDLSYAYKLVCADLQFEPGCTFPAGGWRLPWIFGE